MGQGMNVIVNPEAIAKLKEPADMPECPHPCYYDFSNFAPKAVASTFGNPPPGGPKGGPRGGNEAGARGTVAAASGTNDLLAPEMSNLP